MIPLLSILIPTVVGREQEFNSLYNLICEESVHIEKEGNWTGYLHDPYGDNSIIQGVKKGQIEILFYKDDKIITIGEKRERLYLLSEGIYSWQIDDDDAIAAGALTLILDAIKTFPYPDCITFREKCIINRQYYSSNHSLKYEEWGEHKDGYDFVRTPFMKSVIRTEIARSVHIP